MIHRRINKYRNKIEDTGNRVFTGRRLAGDDFERQKEIAKSSFCEYLKLAGDFISPMPILLVSDTLISSVIYKCAAAVARLIRWRGVEKDVARIKEKFMTKRNLCLLLHSKNKFYANYADSLIKRAKTMTPAAICEGEAELLLDGIKKRATERAGAFDKILSKIRIPDAGGAILLDDEVVEIADRGAFEKVLPLFDKNLEIHDYLDANEFIVLTAPQNIFAAGVRYKKADEAYKQNGTQANLVARNKAMDELKALNEKHVALHKDVAGFMALIESNLEKMASILSGDAKQKVEAALTRSREESRYFNTVFRAKMIPTDLSSINKLLLDADGRYGRKNTRPIIAVNKVERQKQKDDAKSEINRCRAAIKREIVMVKSELPLLGSSADKFVFNYRAYRLAKFIGDKILRGKELGICITLKYKLRTILAEFMKHNELIENSEAQIAEKRADLERNIHIMFPKIPDVDFSVFTKDDERRKKVMQITESVYRLNPPKEFFPEDEKKTEPKPQRSDASPERKFVPDKKPTVTTERKIAPTPERKAPATPVRAAATSKSGVPVSTEKKTTVSPDRKPMVTTEKKPVGPTDRKPTAAPAAKVTKKPEAAQTSKPVKPNLSPFGEDANPAKKPE